MNDKGVVQVQTHSEYLGSRGDHACRMRLSTLLIHSAYDLVYQQTKSACYFLEDPGEWDLLPTPLVHDLVATNFM